MKLNKKVLSFFLIAIFAVVLVACDEVVTTLPTDEATTVEVTEAPTTVGEVTTVEDMTTVEGTEAPTTEMPTTEAPTTEEPTTEAPTTEEPTTVVDLKPVLDAVVAMYADTLDDFDFVAEDDLEGIIAYYGAYYVNWFSSNTDYLSHNGKVTRPLLSEGDQTVIFTVSVTDGVSSESYSFFVTIKALTEKTGQEIADEVFLVATAFPNKTLWSSADVLTFVETAQDADENEYDVTWESSNTDIIALDGSITQPESEDTDVTITATITVNDVKYSISKVFTVAKMAEGQEVATIAEAVALGQDAYVEVLGVTVIAMYNSGDVFFTDGTDILYIYSPPFTAEIGAVYDITGLIDFYYNAPQMAGSDTNPLKAVASDAAASVAPVITGQTVNEVISATSQPSPENPHQYLTYEVTGAVYYEESWGNYSVFLVPSDYDFGAALADGATQPNGNAIMIYYRSDMDVLKAFHGQEVTIEIVMQGYRTDKTVFYANFFGSALNVGITIDDDADAVATALSALNYPTPILEDMTLELPTELYGVALTWSSTDATVIDPVTGMVDVASLETQVMVTLTVNASRGAETGQKEFELAVGELPVTTIADVLAASEGTFLIEGTLISGEYQNTYFIQDATGNIALYTDGQVPVEEILNSNLGNVIQVIGTRAAYNGLEQVKVTEVMFVSESTVPAPTNLDSMELTSANLAAYQGQLIELTNMVVSEVAVDTYGNISLVLTHLTNGTTLNVKWDSRVALPTELNDVLSGLEVGDSINIVSTLGWSNGPLLYVVTSATITEVALSDADKLAADKAALSYGGNVFVALSETLPLVGSNGSTIAWVISADVDSNATLDALTGAFTIAEPTADATVELTATLTLGDATETAVFTFTLLDVTAVDLGDFEAQPMDSTVAIHGVVYAVIGNGFFVEDETGQLFVFTYDAEYNVGDEVELIGTVAAYKGSYQLADPIELPEALSVENDVNMEAVMYEDGVTVLVPGQVYSVMGTVAIEGDHNNVYIYINETDAFEIYYKSPADSIAALEAMVGEMVAVNLIYYNNDTSFVYVDGVDGVALYAEVSDFSELYAMTDGENYDLPNGSVVELTGIVTGNSYDGLFIQDANGVGFFMYKPDETDINIGDEVVYLGVIGEYKEARQLAYGAALVEVVSTGNDLVVTSVTADEIDVFATPDAAGLYSFDGFTYQGLDGSSMILGYTLMDGVTTGTVNVRYYSNWSDLEAVADNYVVGDALPMVEFIVYNFRDDLVQLDVVSVEFTEQNLYDFDVNMIEDPVELKEDMELVAGEYGTTWVVTAASPSLDGYVDYMTTSGSLLVTRPAVGEADVTGTLTVTATNGAVSNSITINVSVPAEVAASSISELFISEYAEGSSSNKYIEIYNGTGADVDLTSYSVELYSNGGTDIAQSLDLTGTLADGDVLIIANSSANQTILDEADYALAYPSVPNWNGNDVVTLSKDGTIIDIIGTIGDDSNFAKDVTLVRNSDITGPNAVYTIAEWTVNPSDDWSDIATHTTD